MRSENTDSVVRLDHSDVAVARQIKHLHDAAYAVEARLLGVEEFPPLNRKLKSYSNASSSFFGYIRDGHCAGSIEIETGEPSIITISSLVVDPNCSRQGIATKLVMHVLDMAGGMRVAVSTAEENYPAIRLYEGLGFRKTERWTTHDGLRIVELAKPTGAVQAP